MKKAVVCFLAAFLLAAGTLAGCVDPGENSSGASGAPNASGASGVPKSSAASSRASASQAGAQQQKDLQGILDNLNRVGSGAENLDSATSSGVSVPGS